MFYNIDFPWKAGTKEDEISMLYLQELELSLPEDPYIIIFDAGLLSSYEAAKYLHHRGKSFIMSCSANRLAPLWMYFKQVI